MGTLVDQAQRAGMFGVAGYAISLRQIMSDDPDDHMDSIIEHQVTLRTPSGAVLASAPIATDHLAGDDVSGMDAAIAVLTNTAASVNELLVDEQRLVANSLDTRRDQQSPGPARPGRSFQPLDLSAAAIAPVVVDPPAPRPSHPRSRR